ncbi:MAG: hypothetical protein AB1649_11350 [Chloroflexota bacterium]
MSDAIIEALITGVSSIVGGVLAAAITAHATIKAAEKKNGQGQVPPANQSKNWMLGFFIGAIAGGCLAVVVLALLNLGQPGVSSAPDLNMYDSFDNSAYDGDLNRGLWVLNANKNMSSYQEGGRLILQASTPTEAGTLWINPTNAVETSFDALNTFEAKFSWGPEIYNHMYLGLTIQQSWTDATQVTYACDFELKSDSSSLQCNGVDGNQESPSEIITVNAGQVYTLRVQVDPGTAGFSAYLDGQLIDTYDPPEPQKWIQGPVSYNLHLGTFPLSSGTGYIDDVRFGQGE